MKSTATVTPRTSGRVLFTLTYTLPDGTIMVGKTRSAKVRGTTAWHRLRQTLTLASATDP